MSANPVLESGQERELNHHKGFTLIELMMVVAVIGILAAIAFPSYQDSLRKGRRADAKAALLDLAQFTERSYTQNNTYSGITLPYNQTPRNGTAYYALALASATTSTVSLTATPIVGSPQASDACGTFSINEAGTKGASGALGVSQCWN
jgi:type IV pilus assembly protein PilE